MVAAGLVVAIGAAGPAAAQIPVEVKAPTFAGFHSVLAQGEGQSVTATDLAAYEASGNPPPSFVNQQPLYVGIMPHAASLQPPDIDTYYKDTRFGLMPGGIASTTSPKAGVTIYRDRRFNMPHIYADNREDLMFGAGYAQAQERLFLMDAIRSTAEGNLAGLTGAGAAGGDADQLTDQDFSPEELTKQFEELPAKYGAPGKRAHDDFVNFVAGINKRIDEVNTNPLEIPAEYPALGIYQVRKWTIADTAAEATFLVTQFTVSNGGEERNAQMQQAFMERFGKRWRRPYTDLREAQDPGAFTVAKREFRSDQPGKPRAGPNAIPDRGSIVKRNAIVSGPGAGQQAEAAAGLPAWVRSVNGLKSALPLDESNAVMVPARMSADGHALAAMGPQVDYFSPQIFNEYELHGGGIDVEGVTFPGAAPYPLIGHGIDFAWSGTSANGDNQDTFVERLCNPDGSTPSKASTHYLYRGECRPFVMRDQQVTTPVSPVDPQPPQKITYRTMRSVHGPVFAFATVGGAPVALAKAKAVDFHELSAAMPFMRLAENEPTSPQSFIDVMGTFPGTENWFYVDRDHVAFQQSGVYPKHAPGSDVDLPFSGDGSGDWQGFDPDTYTADYIPASHRPMAVDPRRGMIISWNNKEAPGWRKGPTEWSNGPVHHAMILQEHAFEQARANGGKLDLTGLTRAVNLAATTDLRGEDDYPVMRRVIAGAKLDARDRQLLGLIDAWTASGSNRLDANGDNLYDHGPAIALFDAWWTRFVRSEFQPVLGYRLFGELEKEFLHLGDVNRDFGWGWASHVQKDLRSVLAQPERGRYSQIYCGGPTKAPAKGRKLRHARRICRNALLTTLRAAADQVARRQGTADPSKWKVPATCDQTSPPSCDQLVPTTAGAVDTPPFPWQNRGTYHQVTEVLGHR